MSESSVEFIARQFVYPIAIVAPDIGVTQGFAQPMFSAPGALAEASQPQNAHVPTAPTISTNERARLSEAGRAFFRNVMRPTIKHV